MSDSTSSNFPAVENMVDLLKAVLAISSQEEIETIAYETCKQIAIMLGVFTVSFASVNLDDKTGKLVSEFISEERETDLRWYQPLHYANMPIFTKVIEEQKTFYFHKNDPAIANAPEMAIFKDFLAQQIILVPILTRNDLFGMLLLWERSPERVFTENDFAFLELLANNVGIIVERSQLFNKSEQRASELEILHDVNLALSSRTDIKGILQTTVDGVFRLDKHILCTSLMLNKNGNLSSGFSRCVCENQTMICPEDNHIALQVLHTGRKIIIEESCQINTGTSCPLYDQVQTLIGLPLKAGDKLLGVLQIAYQKQKEFTTRSIHILEMLADRAAIAVQNIELLEKITNQAMTDVLTGIPNRRAFEHKLHKEIARANRNQSEFCLLFIDLDGFKQINDHFGHPAGDKTLQKVSNCFRGLVRKSDVVARIGGDEFVILLPDTGIAGGEKVAESIRTNFRVCQFDWKQHTPTIELGASVGVVQFPDQADNIEELYKIGDAMLYENKYNAKSQ